MAQSSPFAVGPRQSSQDGAARAYDADAVDAYLGRMTEELQAARAEHARLRHELATKAQLDDDLRATERAIGQALINAQALADNMLIEATSERARLLTEAEAKRARLLTEAQTERARLLDDAEAERVAVLEGSRRQAAALVTAAAQKAETTLDAARREADALVVRARDGAEARVVATWSPVAERATDDPAPAAHGPEARPDGRRPLSSRGRHFLPRRSPPPTHRKDGT